MTSAVKSDDDRGIASVVRSSVLSFPLHRRASSHRQRRSLYCRRSIMLISVGWVPPYWCPSQRLLRSRIVFHRTLLHTCPEHPGTGRRRGEHSPERDLARVTAHVTSDAAATPRGHANLRAHSHQWRFGLGSRMPARFYVRTHPRSRAASSFGGDASRSNRVAANLPLETDRACGAADQRRRWAEMRMDGCLR
jgi:hypothetical protein